MFFLPTQHVTKLKHKFLHSALSFPVTDLNKDNNNIMPVFLQRKGHGLSDYKLNSYLCFKSKISKGIKSPPNYLHSFERNLMLNEDAVWPKQLFPRLSVFWNYYYINGNPLKRVNGGKAPGWVGTYIIGGPLLQLSHYWNLRLYFHIILY